MPLSDNLVEQTSTTTGTGGMTLSSVTGRFDFSEKFATGTGGVDVFYYCIANRDADEKEIGSGSYISSKLKRQTIIDSSNGGARVTFSAGTKDVSSDLPWEYQYDNIPVGTDGVYPAVDKVGTVGKPANKFSGVYLASEGGNGVNFGVDATISRATDGVIGFAAAVAPSTNDGQSSGTATRRFSDVYLATRGSQAGGVDWGASSMKTATSGAIGLLGSYRHTAVNDGTPTGGSTYTVPDAGGNMRRILNGGSDLKFAPQTSDSVVIFFVENTATPGAITATGDYDTVKGDPFTTATGDDFICSSTVINGRSSLVVQDATNDIA